MKLQLSIIAQILAIGLFFNDLHGQAPGGDFRCGMKFMDARDSSEYNTVQIGTQCWMAENLNIGIKVSAIKDQRDNGVIEKYCYDNKEENCRIYGGLYQWSEMMQYEKTPNSRGICPEGWHVPSDEEWCLLASYADSGVDCAHFGATGSSTGILKSAGSIESKTGLWYLPNEGAGETSGFSALPGGTRSIYAKFHFLGYHGYYWTSTENSDQSAWFWYFKYSNNSIYRENYLKNSGYSARCVKDD
ncbi:MAG: FISUMP domain-containing protein [Bacteroidales bacterium]|jgi:uncharacterized protein (TIGR02145 family)